MTHFKKGKVRKYIDNRQNKLQKKQRETTGEESDNLTECHGRESSEELIACTRDRESWKSMTTDVDTAPLDNVAFGSCNKMMSRHFIFSNLA